MLVVEETGAKVTGRVADVSPHEIVLLTPDRRTFALDTVTRITRSDGVWNGALIGAAVGLGPVAGGAIAGAAIDAAISKTLYRSPRTHVKIIPSLAPSRSSLAVAVGF